MSLIIVAIIVFIAGLSVSFFINKLRNEEYESEHDNWEANHENKY